ncbi:class I SAM-dependent methyltransferase [Actinospica acidiphila]|uniref:class I SAM-dependent methyltransferase n=1 Tax=Actinospica acidiphila TaxID=304899 RepID=UPI0033077633
MSAMIRRLRVLAVAPSSHPLRHARDALAGPGPGHLGPGVDGPGDEVLGDLAGLRVLDLGCGTGRHAAHLARAYGARVDGVDASPSQIQRARAHHPDVPGLRLFHADAVDHLGQAEPYDVIYSVSAVHFFDPHRLFPALAGSLIPGGRLYFTVLHTNSEGDGRIGADPSCSAARPENGSTPATATSPPCSKAFTPHRHLPEVRRRST